MIEKIRGSMMANFEVIRANNGEEGYQKYVEHNKDIKLILMDIHMPILNGYQSA